MNQFLFIKLEKQKIIPEIPIFPIFEIPISLLPWRQIPTLTLQPKLVETARAINPKPENSFEKLVVS